MERSGGAGGIVRGASFAPLSAKRPASGASRLSQAAERDFLAARLGDGDIAAVHILARLACLAALGPIAALPSVAAACSPVPPPEPPPQAEGESAEQFVARRQRHYLEIAERQEKASLPGRTALENRLWATAHRVVLARLEKIGSIRLRGSEEQYYKSPLVELRALEWLKGNPSPRRLKVHYLSDNSCDFGGAGEAADGGEVGEIFLIFYRDGPLEPHNLLYTFGKDGVVTNRSREAFGLAGPRSGLGARASDGKHAGQ